MDFVDDLLYEYWKEQKKWKYERGEKKKKLSWFFWFWCY